MTAEGAHVQYRKMLNLDAMLRRVADIHAVHCVEPRGAPSPPPPKAALRMAFAVQVAEHQCLASAVARNASLVDAVQCELEAVDEPYGSMF